MIRDVFSLLFVVMIAHAVTGKNNYTDSLINTCKQQSGQEKIETYLKLTRHFTENNFDSAKIFLSKAQKKAKQINDKKLIVDCLNSKGLLYQKNADYNQSIEIYLKAIELAEKNGYSRKLGTAYNGVGINYYYLKDYQKAKRYLNYAADVKRKHKEFGHLATILTNLSGIYLFEGKTETAVKILRPLETKLKKEKSSRTLASLYTTMGGIQQMGNRNYDSAYYYYNKSLQIGIKKKLHDIIMSGFHNLGQIEIKRGNHLVAESRLKKALELSKQSKNRPLELRVNSSLSELYATTGKFKKAFKAKQQQLKLNQKIFKKEKQKITEDLEVKYQTAHKEKKIKEQKIKIQDQKLKAEQERNYRNQVIFIAATSILILLFITFYFWQRKRGKERLETQKTQIFQNIIHEIRTPINLITGPLQMLKKDKTNLDEQINKIEKNANQLVMLVNELLDASKLEKGKYSIHYKIGNVNLYLEELATPFKSEFQKKNIGFNLALSEKMDQQIQFPENALAKTISNLLSNALKHTPTNGTVSLKTAYQENLLNIEVVNSGQTIPKGEQDKIFERFYRTHQSSNLSGTGIGLSMVKEIVALAGGSISLTSKNNMTTFSVLLPVQNQEAQVKTDNLFQLKEQDIQMLIVEDDVALAIFVQSIFSDKINTQIAYDGQQAIEYIDQNLPDIVLTDVMMPKKDGIDVLKHIKEREISQHIPVVIFSSRTSLQSRINLLSKGADAYIPKPFDINELSLTADNLLQTIKNNQKKFQQQLEQELPFEERVKFKNYYINSCAEHITQNIENNLYSVNELAQDMHASRSQLHRKIKSLTGLTSSHFIRKIRLEKAKDLLKSGQHNITEVAYLCGFSSQSYFSKCFVEEFNEKPSTFTP